MKKSVPNPTTIVVKKVSDNLFIVDPGFVNLGKNQTRVTWKNQTLGKIDVFFPAHGVTGAIRHIHIDKDKTGGIDTESVVDGHYLYTVYCHEGGQFAVAGSHPEMIVP